MLSQTSIQVQNNVEEAGHLFVVKIGGNIIDDEAKLSFFLKSFAELPSKKILVHGGGKLATKLAAQLHLPQRMMDGRRITDAETLKLVTMVYAGLINKTIVAQLQSHQCNAIGLSGVDANAVLAHKRLSQNFDWGFAGDVDAVNATAFHSLLRQGLTPVVAPITHDGQGQLLNTNADTIAQETAKAMSEFYQTTLIYSFEKAGVLMDAADDSSVISVINSSSYTELKTEGRVFAGMIPKLDNAFAALDAGVTQVIIGNAEQLHELVTGKAGTTIVHD